MAHFHFGSDGVAMDFSVFAHPLGILNDFGCSIECIFSVFLVVVVVFVSILMILVQCVV